MLTQRCPQSLPLPEDSIPNDKENGASKRQENLGATGDDSLGFRAQKQAGLSSSKQPCLL